MKNHTPNIWDNTPGLHDALVAALARGDTAAEAARHLSRQYGLKISRNAVTGRAWRQGIDFKGAPTRKPQAPRTSALSRLQARKLEAARARAELARRQAAKVVDLVEPAPRGDVADGCRWLHQEATDRNFCGAPTAGGSWCHYHSQRVFDLVSTRQAARKARARYLEAVA
jgi:hypothetical protein